MANLWQNNLDVAAFLNGSLITIIAFLSLMISRFLRNQKWWVWLSIASICLGFASWFDISLLSSSNVIAPPWISFGLKLAGCISLATFASAVWVNSGGSERNSHYVILAASGITVYSINSGQGVATAVLSAVLFVPTCVSISISMWRYIRANQSPSQVVSWMVGIGAILLAIANLIPSLRTLSPYLPVMEKIQISTIGWAGLVSIITLCLFIAGMTIIPSPLFVKIRHLSHYA